MSELRVHRNLDQLNVSPRATTKLNIVKKIFGDDGFNFKDIVDLINPLHHIPIVGTIYRAISADKIAPAIKLAGGALFGGPAGASLAAMGIIIDKNKVSPGIKIDSNHDRLRREQIEEKVINIDDLVAQRRFSFSKNNLAAGQSLNSRVPSVKNYQSLVSFYHKKSSPDAPHLSPKHHSKFIELQSQENKAILLKERIDRRL